MDAEALFDQIAADLVPRGASLGAMFGARSLMYEGKAVATVKGGRIAAKLGAGSTAHTQALAVGTLFDPSGKGRPFKDWVAFEGQQEPDLVAGFVQAALDRAQGGA